LAEGWHISASKPMVRRFWQYRSGDGCVLRRLRRRAKAGEWAGCTKSKVPWHVRRLIAGLSQNKVLSSKVVHSQMRRSLNTYDDTVYLPSHCSPYQAA
jgi:hypothetical protein